MIILLPALALASALWAVVLHLEAGRRRSRRSGAHTALVLTLFGLMPFAAWALGDREPYLEFAHDRGVTLSQQVVATVGQLLFFAVVGSAVTLALVGPVTPRSTGGRKVWATYLLFVGGIALSMLGGTKPGFRLELLYSAVAVTVVYVYQLPYDRTIQLVRRLLLLYVWGSAIWTVVEPSSLNLAHDRLRLFGVTEHPNGLGAVAAVSLLVVLGTQRGQWRWFNGAVCAGVLMLTDSRTAIAAAAGGVALLYLYRNGTSLTRRAVALLLAAASVVAVLSIASWGASDAVDLGLRAPGVSAAEAQTLQGRTEVWEITLSEWARNPVFGYGPSLWNREYREQFGERLAWAGHAHNQFVQSLGDAGLLGLAGLLVYVAALVTVASRTARPTRGVTLGLVSLLLIRMLSESALRTPGFSLMGFLHLAIVAVLMAADRELVDGSHRAHTSAGAPPGDGIGESRQQGHVTALA